MNFKIIFEEPLTDELKEYLFDCWITFVTQDLGLLPSQAVLIEE